MNFIDIVDSIFVNRQKYKYVTDDEKINNFFIINRKFSRKYPHISNFFNDKNIDKASALDKWFDFFEGQNRIPTWYWGSKKQKSKNDIIGMEISSEIGVTKDDIKFLNKYYIDDIKKEVKRHGKRQ